MSARLQIRNGRVYDPANGINGVVKTIFIEDGKIVAAFAEGEPGRILDAKGMVVMPGGVDMHCHIAGPAINRARRLLPENVGWAPPTAGDRWAEPTLQNTLVPSTHLTGCRYSGLGYTTAIDAAIAPSGTKQAHWELADTPNIDRAFLLLLANNEMLLEALAKKEAALARDLIGLLLARTGAFGIKVVNPGCVREWKHGGDPLAVTSIDQEIGSTSLTPRDILSCMTDVATHFKLPHAVHVHCNRLGVPGNAAITLETLRALAGRRHHLTHLQFHAYADDGKGGYGSGAAALMDHINCHPETTVDVGQVMFGPALTITEDAALEHVLWQMTGQRWVNLDFELESGCGMLPFEFKPKVFLHSLQWAIGMELFLLARDPWRIALSTDHPNGASFLAYPRIIAALMDRSFRDEEIKRANPNALAKTVLKDLHREYSLFEIAIISRAGPARILGLRHKGHLGPGADADVTVYADQKDRLQMFQMPRYVIKSGRLVAEEGQTREMVTGQTYRIAPPIDAQAAQHFQKWMNQYGSYQPEQFGLPETMLLKLASGAA
jgi:formylmethanofuran dehydrogenase subunit A